MIIIIQIKQNALMHMRAMGTAHGSNVCITLFDAVFPRIPPSGVNRAANPAAIPAPPNQPPQLVFFFLSSAVPLSPSVLSLFRFLGVLIPRVQLQNILFL